MMRSVQLAVTLHSPASGRYMDLYTNMPGLQFYSGNNLNGSTVGKGAYPYPVYAVLALETQVDGSTWLLWHCLVYSNWPWVFRSQSAARQNLMHHMRRCIKANSERSCSARHHHACMATGSGCFTEHHFKVWLSVLLCCRCGQTTCTRQSFLRASCSLARCTATSGTCASTPSPLLQRQRSHPQVSRSRRQPL